MSSAHPQPQLHVVQYSSGIGSWAAAQRVAATHGTDRLVLLFADVLTEDDDNYRFLYDSADQLGVPITRVCDGRTPWEVFADKRFLGNSRFAPCTGTLKIRPCRAWLNAHAESASTVLYVGLEASPRDRRRAAAITAGWSPWRVEYPMLAEPLMTKQEMLDWSRSLGLTPPRLYDLGFGHANCAGACVRAGQAQWRHLLRVFPDRFAKAEAYEQRLRAQLGDVAILRRTRAGRTTPLPLRQLREEILPSPRPGW